jgi:hypothetical protein
MKGEVADILFSKNCFRELFFLMIKLSFDNDDEFISLFENGQSQVI